jgi:hypothetical protein
MKAEQRKELETNTLADKMGHVMQRAKASPRRTIFTYLFVTAVLVGGSWLGWNYYKGYRASSSEPWVRLYDGSGNFINDLAEKDKESNAGKAARFQIAWFHYWDFGVKTLAKNPQDSLNHLKLAGKWYDDLAVDCKDDPNFEPQALLGAAVVEETLAIQNIDHLKKAMERYETIVDKHKDSAEAKFAQQRLELFKTNDKKRDLEETYTTLQDLLKIPPRMPQFNQGGGLDPFPPPKGKQGP